MENELLSNTNTVSPS